MLLGVPAFSDPPPGPTITSITPDHGPPAGNTEIRVKGTGFAKLRRIDFYFDPASAYMPYQIHGDTEIIAYTPAEVAGTVATLRVTTPTGTATLHSAYTYDTPPVPPPPLPEVDTISPLAIAATSPITMVLTGLHFTGATAVTQGPFNVPALSYTVDSDTQITASFAPNGTTTDNNPEFVELNVTTAGGTGVSSGHFTWTGAYSISPDHGSAYGSGTIEINGVGFTGAISASLNGVDCPDFTFVNDSIIRFTLPASVSVGAVALNVYYTDATLNFQWDACFTYIAPLTITSISPPSGPESGSFTLTGTGFLHATDVQGNGFSLGTWAIVDDNTITAVEDPEGPALPYVASITVTDGTYSPSIPYNVGPQITGVTPSSGTIHGGDAMTITGFGFTGCTDVRFLGAFFLGTTSIPAVSVVVVSDTEITLTTPDWSVGLGHGNGPAHIIIVVPYGIGSFDAGNTWFTYHP